MGYSVVTPGKATEVETFPEAVAVLMLALAEHRKSGAREIYDCGMGDTLSIESAVSDLAAIMFKGQHNSIEFEAIVPDDDGRAVTFWIELI